jgi:hypothetical protein
MNTWPELTPEPRSNFLAVARLFGVPTAEVGAAVQAAIADYVEVPARPVVRWSAAARRAVAPPAPSIWLHDCDPELVLEMLDEAARRQALSRTLLDFLPYPIPGDLSAR